MIDLSSINRRRKGGKVANVYGNLSNEETRV